MRNTLFCAAALGALGLSTISPAAYAGMDSHIVGMANGKVCFVTLDRTRSGGFVFTKTPAGRLEVQIYRSARSLDMQNQTNPVQLVSAMQTQMQSQGVHPVTIDPDGHLKFENGQGFRIDVALAPDGGISGKATSTNTVVGIRGICR